MNDKQQYKKFLTKLNPQEKQYLTKLYSFNKHVEKTKWPLTPQYKKTLTNKQYNNIIGI